eukprot:4641180-Pyramimonas_sp.AAC.1
MEEAVVTDRIHYRHVYSSSSARSRPVAKVTTQPGHGRSWRTSSGRCARRSRARSRASRSAPMRGIGWLGLRRSWR